MKKLESEFQVHRYDIKTKEKKMIKKYSEIVKKHENLDLRLNEDSINELIKLNKYTLNKIFYLLSDSIPEEHILFLYEPSKFENTNLISSPKNVRTISIDTSVDINSENRLEISESENPHSNNKNKNSDTILDSIKNVTMKNIKNVTIGKYYSISCITFLIYGFLTLLHLFRYLKSKEVS